MRRPSLNPPAPPAPPSSLPHPSRPSSLLQPLTAYLKGEFDTTPGVVPLPVGDLPVLAGGKREAEAADEAAAAATKRARPGEAAPAAEAGGAASDVAAVATTRALEAPWSVRDRNAPLMAAAKDFSFAIVKAESAAAAARADAARAFGAGGGGGGARPAGPSRPAPIPALPSRRFDRTDAPGATAAALDDMGLGGGEGGEGDGVLAYGEVLGGGVGPSAGAGPALDDPDPEGTAAAAAAAAVAAKATAAAAAKAKAAAAVAAAARRPAPPARPAPSSKPRTSLVPIIIVPAAATARINLLNAAPFLEEGRFVPAEEARAAGAKKPADGKVLITRTIGRGGGPGSGGNAAASTRPPVPYEVTDRAPPPQSPDWARVVAVFVGGAAWQFKGWPFPGAEAGDTVRLFSQAAGFHVSLADEAAPPAVKEWNVTRLTLHRTERHRDRSTVERVWRAIDDFLGPRGSRLAY